MIEFTYPWVLLGLLAAPVLWWWARSRMGESRRWLGWVTIALRGLFLVLLLAALAQPTMRLPERRTDWLFLVDRSHSMPATGQDLARDLVYTAESGRATNDRIAVMSFASGTALDVAFGETIGDKPFGKDLEGGSTLMENAIQAALAEFTDQHRQRLVLLSDGNETGGSAVNAVASLVSRGIPLHTVAPPADENAAEVAVENVIAPPVVRRGDRFAADVVVSSARDTEAVLQVFQDREPAGQYRVALKPGRNVFPLELDAEEEGQHLIRAVIDSKADHRPENNQFQRFQNVEGGSRILIVAGEGTDSRPMAGALKAQGLRVTVVPIAGLPGSQQALLQHDVIIFDNAPGLALSRTQMEMLEAYVRDHGGGFLMLGGDRSFGGGGYHETPLEKMLPVSMDVDTQVKVPTVALVLVIDRSDSMSAKVGDSPRSGSKLEVAKLAAFSAVQLLNPTDRVGLVAFDVDAQWAVPLTLAGRREEIAGRISAIKPGGGTDLYMGLQIAVEELQKQRAVRKHIIALTDGLTPARQFEELVKSAAGERITLSTVAMGNSADQHLLRSLASWGGGRFYFTNDPTRIPRIFTTETIMVSRGLVEEVDFTPRVHEHHEILEGIDVGRSPELHGYVVTSAKPGAELILGATETDPLLAVRQYGLGRTAAFTSDLSTAWGKDWLKWPAYSRFVNQLVRWAERRSGEGNLELQVRPAGEQAEVLADLFDADGRFLNQFALQARITYPDQSLREVPLQQEAPGRYRGLFPLARTGEYLLSVAGKRNGGSVGPKAVGLTVPYAPEYRTFESNTKLLRELAERTGGAFLAGPDIQDQLTELMRDDQGEEVRKPIWVYLVVAGMLFFLLDIALRQLGWTPGAKEEDRPAERPPRGGPVNLEEAVARRAARSARNRPS